MYEVSSGGIPEFTGTIIAAGEELIAVLIETAVGKGEYMAFEFFDKGELLLFFVLDFLDEFWGLMEMNTFENATDERSFGLGDERFFSHDLWDELIDICVFGEVQ